MCSRLRRRPTPNAESVRPPLAPPHDPLGPMRGSVRREEPARRPGCSRSQAPWTGTWDAAAPARGAGYGTPAVVGLAGASDRTPGHRSCRCESQPSLWSDGLAAKGRSSLGLSVHRALVTGAATVEMAVALRGVRIAERGRSRSGRWSATWLPQSTRLDGGSSNSAPC
jgi:hypothetical protein